MTQLPKAQVDRVQLDSERWDPGKVFLGALLGGLLICVGLPCAYWAYDSNRDSEVVLRKLEQTDPLRFIAPCGVGQ